MMAEDFGPTYITMVDEETGDEFELEHLDSLDYEGITYAAFAAVTEHSHDGDCGEEEEVEEVIILRVIQEDDGTESFETVDDDDLAEKVFEAFMEQFDEE